MQLSPVMRTVLRRLILKPVGVTDTKSGWVELELSETAGPLASVRELVSKHYDFLTIIII